jgi:hypothetical protein
VFETLPRLREFEQPTPTLRGAREGQNRLTKCYERDYREKEVHAAADANSATLAAASNVLAQRVLRIDMELL